MTNLVDDGLVVFRREHEVNDRPDHPGLRAGVSPRHECVKVVLLLEDVVHLAVPRHQTDTHNAPLLHVYSTRLNGGRETDGERREGGGGRAEIGESVLCTSGHHQISQLLLLTKSLGQTDGYLIE